jgi:hypothetical protein
VTTSKAHAFSVDLKTLLTKHNAEMLIDDSDPKVPVICVKFIRPKKKPLMLELGYHFDKDWQV